MHKCKQQTVCPVGDQSGSRLATAATATGSGGGGLIPILGIPRRLSSSGFAPFNCIIPFPFAFHSVHPASAYGELGQRNLRIFVCVCCVCVSVCGRGNVAPFSFQFAFFCSFLVNLQLSCQRKMEMQNGKCKCKACIAFPEAANLQFVSEI